MKNKWKISFFVLLGIVALTLGVLFFMITAPADDMAYRQGQLDEKKESVKLQVKTNKSDMNKVLNHYLEEESKAGSIDYRVALGEEVELYGTMPLFSENVNMKMTFEPKALKNGDLVLRQKNISVGSLNLPVSYVLKMVMNNYNLPEFVYIQPNEEMVYISLQKLKLKGDVKVRADRFDLQKDNISFTLQVPAKTEFKR
ncbi:YpmS family protein [Mesobacillus zeae]|uniref:DUF2140 family protein n=1 Tax=Mesobacillus zeae TaxID=1917180 RepID=A0A398B5N2_9BACI|nr:YpmS family protein [Mesobacillus zeae]RID84128.1 DUF2140 family protein [Mesobacillus zeae]